MSALDAALASGLKKGTRPGAMKPAETPRDIFMDREPGEALMPEDVPLPPQGAVDRALEEAARNPTSGVESTLYRWLTPYQKANLELCLVKCV